MPPAQVRVFDSTGEWKATIGRKGQGPGEAVRESLDLVVDLRSEVSIKTDPLGKRLPQPGERGTPATIGQRRPRAALPELGKNASFSTRRFRFSTGPRPGPASGSRASPGA